MRTCVLLVLLAAIAAPVRAQTASGSAAALGMGDNYTAAARGYNAVAWNPAVLGLADNPPFSFTLLALRGGNGLAPVTLGDLADWADRVVPDAVRQDWLSRIAAEGAQRGAGEVQATWAAVQVGRLAFEASTRVRARTNVSPGVAELIMFGNAGEQGVARELDLSGSSLGAQAWSTLAASLAVPWQSEAGLLSLGATVTWTMGHVFASGERSTGVTTAAPVAVGLEFPLVQTSFDSFRPNAGSGFGLDLGAALQSGGWTLSLVRRNVVNGFAWNIDRLEYRPLAVDLTARQASTDTEAMPLADAPESVRAAIAEIGFSPSWSAGAAFRPSEDLRMTFDARFPSDRGMSEEPVRHLGAGVEVALLPWLPVRAGGVLRSYGPDGDGWLLGGGIGFRAGPWGVDAAVARESGGSADGTTLLMLSLTSIGAH